MPRYQHDVDVRDLRSGRARYAVANNYTSWEAVAQVTEREFSRHKNVGHRTVMEVREALARRGLSFAEDRQEPHADRLVDPNNLRPSDDEINRRARIIVANALCPLEASMLRVASEDSEGNRVTAALRKILRGFR